MRILITGASGQLGHDCVAEAERRGHKVFGFGRVELDITDHDAVNAAVQDIRPDCVLHCAAWTNVDGAEENEEACRRINVAGTQNVAEAAGAVGAKMIYISTDYVFDGRGTAPWTPEDRTGPLNAYGRSKLDGEAAVRNTLDQYSIVRTSWLYGGQGKNFVRTMLRIGSERDAVRVVDDQIGTPTYTTDLARLLVDMAESDLYGTYHAVNTGGYISWYDFTREIYRLAGIATTVMPVSSEEYGAKAVRPKNSRLDTGKLTDAGFAQLPAWQDALERYLRQMNYGTDQSNL